MKIHFIFDTFFQNTFQSAKLRERVNFRKWNTSEDYTYDNYTFSLRKNILSNFAS